MKSLVTVSSRHGATAELATEIGRILRETLDAPVTVDAGHCGNPPDGHSGALVLAPSRPRTQRPA